MLGTMPTPPESDIRDAIGALLDARAARKTICPSDVARRLRDEGWRELMEPVRAVGRAMAAEGALEVTQRGRVVDPAAARGPIRYRRPHPA
jgi:hypothetical protein